MTRFWPNGQQIHVGCDALGTPDWLVWQGRRYTVAHVLERWRVDERWWQGRAWREYFTVLTASGLLLTLYHDVTGGAWYLQRLYD